MISQCKGFLLMIVLLAFPLSAEALEPTVDVFIENPLQPIIHGATNLPDGSELMLSLARSESGYGAQGKMTVQNGHFVTDQFSSGGRPLNPGIYTVEVSMSIAALQPENVQLIIGKEGQRMTGKFVSRAPFGGLVFDYVTRRQLGGPSNAIMDEASRAQSGEDFRKWTVASCVSITDTVNAAVRSGMVTGRQKLGSERDAAIGACVTQLNSRSPR